MSIKPVESFARIGTMYQAYAEVVEKSYSEYLSYEKQIKLFEEVEYSEELETLKHQLNASGLQTIVFSAMCFEASIYDFASIHLGDEYVRSHIDKLDTLSKWVIVLRFVSGIDLQRDQAPYGRLKKLINTRNKLVHTKSEQFEFEHSSQIKQIDKLHKMELEYTENVHNALRAIITMSQYLDYMHKGHHNPLPSYNEESASMRRYYSELKAVSDECRRSVLKIVKS